MPQEQPIKTDQGVERDETPDEPVVRVPLSVAMQVAQAVTGMSNLCQRHNLTEIVEGLAAQKRALDDAIKKTVDEQEGRESEGGQ